MCGKSRHRSSRGAEHTADNGRLGQQGSRGNARSVKGTVPLSEMFGYATAVRSISQGRASFTMEPSHYEEVPSNVQKAIVEKNASAMASKR